jgi:hypothetical protein
MYTCMFRNIDIPKINLTRENVQKIHVRLTCYADQGCQMVCFQTKNPNLGKFWRALDWKMLIYFMPIWNILRSFRIFYNHLSHFSRFWYHVPRKSGNPDADTSLKPFTKKILCFLKHDKFRARTARLQFSLFACCEPKSNLVVVINTFEQHLPIFDSIERLDLSA